MYHFTDPETQPHPRIINYPVFSLILYTLDGINNYTAEISLNQHKHKTI